MCLRRSCPSRLTRPAPHYCGAWALWRESVGFHRHLECRCWSGHPVSSFCCPLSLWYYLIGLPTPFWLHGSTVYLVDSFFGVLFGESLFTGFAFGIDCTENCEYCHCTWWLYHSAHIRIWGDNVKEQVNLNQFILWIEDDAGASVTRLRRRQKQELRLNWIQFPHQSDPSIHRPSQQKTTRDSRVAIVAPTVVVVSCVLETWFCILLDR